MERESKMMPDQGGVHPMDIASVAALIGVLTSVLPVIASALTVVWMIIRIYETETVQNRLKRRRLKRSLKAKKKRPVKPLPLGDDPMDPV